MKLFKLNTLVYKILLYLSAFVPMYVLLLIKFIIEMVTDNLSKDFLNVFMVILLSVLTVCGIVGVIFVLKQPCKKKEKITITSSSNTTDQHFLSYFSLFVLFALTFELEKMSMAIVFIFILVFVGIVYIKNNLYHINPFLNILGYSFYNIECIDKNNNKQLLKVFYKGKLEESKEYSVCNLISNFIVIETNKKST